MGCVLSSGQVIENETGWTVCSQIWVKLRCLAQGSWEGFELGESHLSPNLPPLPAATACASKMLISLAVSLGIRGRKVVRGELLCSPLQMQPGEPSCGLLPSVTCPLYFQCYKGAGDWRSLSTLIVSETPPIYWVSWWLHFLTSVYSSFSPCSNQRCVLKKEFRRNATLMISFQVSWRQTRGSES